MSTPNPPVDRIQALVSAGKVSPQEGERLLAAVTSARTSRSAWSLVFNPFERFGGERAALAGLAVSALGVGVARLGVRFNGLLDLHLAHSPVPLGTALRDQATAWLVPALLFWAYARLASAHVRLVDFAGVVGLARIPLVLDALVTVALDPAIPDPGAAPHLSAALLVVAFGTLAALAWFVTLLYTGFRNASGLAGARLVGGFIGLLVGAEIVAQVVTFLSR